MLSIIRDRAKKYKSYKPSMAVTFNPEIWIPDARKKRIKEAVDDALTALARSDPLCAEVFELREAGFTIEEIVDEMGKNRAAVRRKMAKAKEFLEEFLKEFVRHKL